jgi:hypothetical protein
LTNSTLLRKTQEKRCLASFFLEIGGREIGGRETGGMVFMFYKDILQPRSG